MAIWWYSRWLLYFFGALLAVAIAFQSFAEQHSTRTVCLQHLSCAAFSRLDDDVSIQQFEFWPIPIIVSTIGFVIMLVSLLVKTDMPRPRKRQSFILYACYRV